MVGAVGLCSAANAADKPPLAPDAAVPFSTNSRLSASLEFSLPALAEDIERNIPRRLASIDERISCVHRRVLFWKVNANCDVWGYVERSGPVSLYGRGDRVYGSVPIYGALEGQGANRFTARIHGETEASATIEASARPRLDQDWSLDLDFSDGFRWSEPPVLRVMGHEIPLAKYAEPRIRSELGTVRSHALAAARRLDLRDKAAAAWRHAFEPIELSSSPAVWLQMTPQSVSFAGMQASSRTLRGSIELSGTAQTLIGQNPPALTATELPPLAHSVDAPGAFDVILPVRIGYDVLKDRLMQAVAAMPPAAGFAVRDVEIYPSSGKLVVGLRVAGSAETGADAGKWVYLSGAVQADADGRMIRLSGLDVMTTDEGLSGLVNPIAAALGSKFNADYGLAYDNLLSAANARLNRPLNDGFRMEGNLASARLETISLLADGVVIAVRASAELKILYGM
ncbi:DUF4403 family protein [Bradyrhizobium sp. CCGE-LA001]|uniref:DUF4403 family protein n=1 Tax=Bradyrhizobium sp. CCGE-LA001 TaxID=1223566 RepID=UPI000745D89D|nr:DUF4403 family protein [Bradyrhizobium sp. CCGE-LA001]AMA56212.1 hypothetical protein BCCGELA001_08040 [Bradyrhizobium sp. CCGE-LA001]